MTCRLVIPLHFQPSLPHQFCVGRLLIIVLAVATSAIGGRGDAADWKPVEGKLMTRWAKDVTPDKVHPEYPRPQMVRDAWQNLNGLWDGAIRPMAEEQPAKFDWKILVPFPVESALSGVAKSVGPDNRLWYRRTFEIPAAWSKKRILLHAGAIDWHAKLWVNGKLVGEHQGGYDPINVDITDALKPGPAQEISIAVADPSDGSFQPRGKQVRNPHGIWYTPTTGIWQTIWIEPVPEVHIESMKIVPDIDRGELKVRVTIANDNGHEVRVTAYSGNKEIASNQSDAKNEITLKIPNMTLWTPDNPFLYGVVVQLEDASGKRIDEIQSYAGMRKISLGKDKQGLTRILFNNEPLFQYGPLDQGFWPDGLYTAPSDEALRYDIEMTKKWGFNMARKHVKVEPDRWYYWCDKLGLLVWQDMPSGDRYIRPQDRDIVRSPESIKQFEAEWKAIIEANFNHPSIVMWVPFNEGWGQFDTSRIVDLTRKFDGTRLVNSASGWTDRGVGDVHDIHIYPGPASPKPEEKRAAVLGEYGGLGLPMKGHTWQDEKNWGYRSYQSVEELTDAYSQLIFRLRPLIRDPGLSAAVYTQTTDVEIEVNGLMTYDRQVVKIPTERLAAEHRKLSLPPPKVSSVIPTSQENGQPWQFTTNAPDESWYTREFDDSKWQKGTGGFGSQGTPGAAVRTEWKTNDIWMRRTIDLPSDIAPDKFHLSIHHDEDAEIYVNGELAAKVVGYTVDYVIQPFSQKGRAAFKPGKNVIAVHCKQTGGGQYIDVGILEVTETK